MGNDRAWTIWTCSYCGYAPGNHRNWCNAGCGRDYNEMIPVSVVELSRLREAEAEWDTALSFHEAAAIQRLQEAEARAERLEAELREAREALDWVTTRYESTLAGKSVRDADEAICRARGVLEKGDTG